MHTRLVGARTAAAITGDIDCGEQEQPHNINEMPVPGSRFETEMLVSLEVIIGRPHEADEQEDRADDHMEAVEAGRHEEGRAINMAREAEMRMAIFVRLKGGEAQAQHNRHGQPAATDAIFRGEIMMKRPRRTRGKGRLTKEGRAIKAKESEMPEADYQENPESHFPIPPHEFVAKTDVFAINPYGCVVCGLKEDHLLHQRLELVAA